MRALDAARRLGISFDEVIERLKRGAIHIDIRDYSGHSERIKRINEQRKAEPNGKK